MINKVILIGRVTKDLELQTKNTKNYLRFTLAVNRNFKNAQGDYDADFVNCVAFNDTATLLANHVAKGHQIAIEGSIRTNSWVDAETQAKNFSTEVAVERISFLEKRAQAPGAPVGVPGAIPGAPVGAPGAAVPGAAVPGAVQQYQVQNQVQTAQAAQAPETPGAVYQEQPGMQVAPGVAPGVATQATGVAQAPAGAMPAGAPVGAPAGAMPDDLPF